LDNFIVQLVDRNTKDNSKITIRMAEELSSIQPSKNSKDLSKED